MSDFAQIRFLPNRPLLRELSADRLNTILQEIKRNKPKGERGITVRQDGTGTYIGLAASLPRGGTSTPATETHPFQITSRQDPDSDPEDPTYLVTIRPGTINALLPTDIFDGTALNEFSLAADTLSYVVLSATSDGEQITSATVSLESSPPTAQTPAVFGLPASADFLLGAVFNTSVYQVISTNLSLTGKQQYIASKDAPAEPGELPYEIYYVWG
jgi:hypothetical protein